MIELKNLSKTFTGSGGEVQALKNVSLTVRDGEIYGIIGMSGAGKSTLVRCMNLLERPSEGQVLLDGQDLGRLSERELREVRRQVTMIFQGFHLLMQRTVLRNVCFPLELAGMKRREARARAGELLKLVGLPDKAGAYPSQLSGGQQQRVAIARALATEPKVLLCDEATSALDPKTTHDILSLIRDINKRLGITVIVITHQMSVIQEICDRVAILEDGSVIEEGSVAEVFSNPQTEATRRLVFPDSADSEPEMRGAGNRVRVIFNGALAANTPLIAQMAMEKRIAASIVYASTRSVGEKIYGHMLLSLPGGEEERDAAVAYLQQTENVVAEKVENE